MMHVDGPVRDRLLTAPEAAALLGISVKTVRAWTYRRRIPFVRLLHGRAVRYSEKALQKMIDRCTVQPLVPPRSDDGESGQ